MIKREPDIFVGLSGTPSVDHMTGSRGLSDHVTPTSLMLCVNGALSVRLSSADVVIVKDIYRERERERARERERWREWPASAAQITIQSHLAASPIH